MTLARSVERTAFVDGDVFDAMLLVAVGKAEEACISIAAEFQILDGDTIAVETALEGFRGVAYVFANRLEVCDAIEVEDIIGLGHPEIGALRPSHTCIY